MDVQNSLGLVSIETLGSGELVTGKCVPHSVVFNSKISLMFTKHMEEFSLLPFTVSPYTSAHILREAVLFVELQ